MIVLPYSQKPKLLCYHNKAFPIGIIEANSPTSIVPWLCTKCVNCTFSPSSPRNKFNLSAGDIWGVGEKIMTQQTISIKKTFFELYGWDLLDILRKSINNHCYIHGNYNEKFIPYKEFYNKADFTHDFLIVGCSEDYFYSVGYIYTGRFELYEIPVQNFLDSLTNVNGEKIHLNLFSYNQGAIPTPNIKRMISDLDKYFFTHDRIHIKNTTSTTSGIASMFQLKEFFRDEAILDRRYALAFLEHKWILKEIVRVFVNEDECVEFAGLVDNNYNKAEIIHMLSIKMLISPNTKYISSVADYIDEIIDAELKYIPKLINLLKEKYENNLV